MMIYFSIEFKTDEIIIMEGIFKFNENNTQEN